MQPVLGHINSVSLLIWGMKKNTSPCHVPAEMHNLNLIMSIPYIYPNWDQLYITGQNNTAKISRSLKSSHPPKKKKNKWWRDYFRLKENNDTRWLNTWHDCWLNPGSQRNIFSPFAIKDISKTTGEISVRSTNEIIIWHQC